MTSIATLLSFPAATETSKSFTRRCTSLVQTIAKLTCFACLFQLFSAFPQIFDAKRNPNPPGLPGKKVLSEPLNNAGCDDFVVQWFGNMDEAVIQERREKLEQFIQECLE